MPLSGVWLRRFLRRQWPALLVLAVLAGAPVLLEVAPGHWLRAAGLVAASALLAGLFRLFLPERQVGWLVVRARWFDVVCYTGLGVAILVTGVALPG